MDLLEMANTRGVVMSRTCLVKCSFSQAHVVPIAPPYIASSYFFAV